MISPRLNISFFVPKSKWGRWIGKPDWHPNMAQASVWIRGFQLAPYLRRLGYNVTCNKLDPLPDVGIFLRSYDRPDINLAQKIKDSGGKVILDVVVNYFEPRPHNRYGYGDAPDSLVGSFLELISIADQVWTVSPYLQSLASKYNPSTHFISDSVDPVHFTSPEKRFSTEIKPIILGWSGIESKAHSLDEISNILRKFIENQAARVLVISNRKPKLSFPFIYKKWSYFSFPKLIAQCDLCIAPRVIENNYDLGHSIYKIGVFMASGIPALAGPIPAYNLLLNDHRAGEICDSLDAWDHHLSRYINDLTLRKAASVNAREKMKPFLTPNIASQVDQLIKNLYQ